jgi:IS30 family transposase
LLDQRHRLSPYDPDHLPREIELIKLFRQRQRERVCRARSLFTGPRDGVYFAHPYPSWEWDTKENTNGLIRRPYPKPSSFADLGPAALKRLETFLNDRLRKGLDWRTPREKLTVFLDCSPG